jgi:uncharacterized protein (DUF302 family)/uncharacterized OsmC-like protein
VAASAEADRPEETIMSGYTLSATVDADFAGTVAAARDALAGQGFGVLTEIDVQDTLARKLGVHMPAEVILGACNPALAHRAMLSEPSVAALLPCNVVVRELDRGQTLVEAVDPAVLVTATGNPALQEVADDARALLGAALRTLAGPPAVAADGPAPETADSGDHVVRALPAGGDRFLVRARGHTVAVDQPVRDGGTDTAATPTELFVASLTACVAHYANRYLGRHELSAQGLLVETSYETATRPARVGGLEVLITAPPDLPPSHRDRLLAVASHCTVHNTLEHPPRVTIRLMDVTTAHLTATGAADMS